ncbi:tRNA pseudouridine(55) synthase TruB [Porphyromonas circumdentaria]|uniref:tRNA pseudouridine synthase B n=1 Tax=Porphyromonas circumdentaria TaxID=29524 RepID=A0A1T4NFS8_9PORP|nr:tRNA pseudouridine(55) synthase TruB [Porphyromonas circumdentaria]MBB6275657.1 tRNA pseudouridine55 synthase [Porphyromonas circumdentaria]MDO4721896.1 tRNA pseudouridine(55) synthase TruB [Porphyromonas circumdentaria]SJZ77638.1 tRNA pseudouridine55 synthase [Porphyromonas circumdentaria]
MIQSKKEGGIPLLLRTGAIIPIDKPLDWTSFDAVNRFRILVKHTIGLKKLKVGHTGTLDPKATGLLLLCTGRATKRIEELMLDTKEYVATIKLGATTPSFDTEHPEDATYPYEHITREQIETILSNFRGEIQQVPPIFSAVSINGKRAYDLARKGKEADLPAKTITIHELEIEDFSLPYVKLRIVCGKGTYIRSLARDLGEALDSGAYLTALKRTRLGSVSVEDAYTLEELPTLLATAALQEEGFPDIILPEKRK